MDSTVLMVAWQDIPDPGLMPPVSPRDKNEEKADAIKATPVHSSPARPGK